LSRKLFTVGPVHVDQEVLEAMTAPMITHRSKDYKNLHGSVVEKIRKALGTDMDVFMVGGSASVFLEGAIRNGASRRTLGLTNGSFGDRFIEIAELNGRKVDKVRADWGKAVTPAHVEGRVSGDVEAVHWVSNESSTGVLSDSVAVAEAVRAQNPDALALVDAVTSAFASDLDLKRLEPDALVFGTQKALALPPGIAVMIASERLLAKAKTVQDRGFYTDLLKIKKQSDDNYALTTPPVSLMYALDFQLDRALREGMPARYRRHREMEGMVAAWAESRLEGVFPEAGRRSATISVLNRGALDFERFNAAIKARGYEISSGYGDVKEKTFRIGHMGDVTPKALGELLEAMDGVLEEMQ
jgi:aspartate aminotransferase-like enzyme